MFMFQGGLLATFIPEILMVIAYLVCLFNAGSKPDVIQNEPSALVVQVSIIERESASFYTVSTDSFHVFNFQFSEQVNYYLQLVCENQKCDTALADFVFMLPDSISFVQFSRPPPSLFS